MGERKEMGWEKGIAMRHTCNRRVEDAEEVGPPRGGWVGGEGLDPSPLPMLCALAQKAGAMMIKWAPVANAAR